MRHNERNRFSALHWACHCGNESFASALLDGKYDCIGGSDINSMRNGSFSPLILACHRGHAGVARLLLDRGAARDLQHSENFTALHAACLSGHTDVVRLLISRGAPPLYASLRAAAHSGPAAMLDVLCAAAPGAAAAFVLPDPVCSRDPRLHGRVIMVGGLPYACESVLRSYGATGSVEAQAFFAESTERNNGHCKIAQFVRPFR
jgi:ankyrin repeat protein